MRATGKADRKQTAWPVELSRIDTKLVRPSIRGLLSLSRLEMSRTVLGRRAAL